MMIFFYLDFENILDILTKKIKKLNVIRLYKWFIAT